MKSHWHVSPPLPGPTPGPGPPHFRSLTITLGHDTVGRTADVWPTRGRDLSWHNTHNRQNGPRNIFPEYIHIFEFILGFACIKWMHNVSSCQYFHKRFPRNYSADFFFYMTFRLKLKLESGFNFGLFYVANFSVSLVIWGRLVRRLEYNELVRMCQARVVSIPALV